MRLRSLLTGGTLFVVAAAQVHAQTPEPPRARTFAYSTDDDDRPVIGVNTASTGGKRDTLGLLVTSVTAGGPAERAGIEEGTRIAAINGVNLRLSAADAGEPDMTGVASRRLSREIRKVRAGDEVELRLWQNGAARTVRVKTIAADDLRPARASRTDSDDRAVLGLALSPSGTRRDTLGIFVSRVEPDGPAERAGLVEGDRIASINGIDLRVAREDAGDEVLASSKHSRFTRAMREVRAGTDVELRVYSGGTTKTVRVRAGRNEDVYGRRDRGWIGGFGGESFAVPRIMVPPRAPVAPGRVRVYRDGWQTSELDGAEWEDFGRRMAELGARVGERMSRLGPEVSDRVREAMERVWVEMPQQLDLHRWQQDELDAQLESEREAAGAATTTTAPRARTSRDLEAENRELTRRLRETEARQSVAGARTASVTAAPTPRPGMVSATATGSSFTIGLPGLRLSAMNPDLASYLGEGSERGLLVVEADARWRGLRAGDVLLAIDGRPVRDGERASIPAELGRSHELLVLRAGTRHTVRLATR